MNDKILEGFSALFFCAFFRYRYKFHTGAGKTPVASFCHITPCGTLSILLCIFILLACFSLLIRRVRRPFLTNLVMIIYEYVCVLRSVLLFIIVNSFYIVLLCVTIAQNFCSMNKISIQNK